MGSIEVNMKNMKIGDIIKIKPSVHMFGLEDLRPTGLIVRKWQESELLLHDDDGYVRSYDIIEVFWSDNCFEEITLSDTILEILEVINEC